MKILLSIKICFDQIKVLFSLNCYLLVGLFLYLLLHVTALTLLFMLKLMKVLFNVLTKKLSSHEAIT